MLPFLPSRLARPMPFLLTAILCLIGCAPLPDIAAATQTAPAPAPALVPIDGILMQADALGAGRSAVGDVDARAARLRDRAASLRRQ